MQTNDHDHTTGGEGGSENCAVWFPPLELHGLSGETGGCPVKYHQDNLMGR